MNGKHILISRTDAIGDVMLTLPMCGWLKQHFPEAKISFLGRTYTDPVISCCNSVDTFLNYDYITGLDEKEQIEYLQSKMIDVIIHVFPRKEIASLTKKAGIPVRIGTRNRLYHWLTCNKQVALSRKNSPLHEAQLNMELLKPLGHSDVISVKQLPGLYNFCSPNRLDDAHKKLLSKEKFNLILHPKSNGSGKEWSLQRFEELISILPKDQFQVFISGSSKEKSELNDWIAALSEEVTDLTGIMDLNQFISFIRHADGLIASGTGPLHIAAAAGINTLGLFPNMKSINARRWGPVGEKAEFIESTDDTLEEITAIGVFKRINEWKKGTTQNTAY